MKHLTILLLAALTLMACSKDDNESDDTAGSGPTGVWILTEQLVDPGGGATFLPINSSLTLTLSADQTFISNGEMCTMSDETIVGSSGTWSLTESTLSPASCSHRVLGLELNSSQSELIIRYPCIEPCAQKFTRL